MHTSKNFSLLPMFGFLPFRVIRDTYIYYFPAPFEFVAKMIKFLYCFYISKNFFALLLKLGPVPTPEYRRVPILYL